MVIPSDTVAFDRFRVHPDFDGEVPLNRRADDVNFEAPRSHDVHAGHGNDERRDGVVGAGVEESSALHSVRDPIGV